jgi:hypothetical protein
MDMPTKKRTVAAQAAARGPLREMPAELIEQLVQGPMSPSEVQDLFLSFQKAVIERAMSAEMSHHLGYKPGEEKPEGQTNERNGASGKTVLTDKGAVRIDVPRDRAGSFEPILIPKHERRFAGFDDKIIAMYARGMSVREMACACNECQKCRFQIQCCPHSGRMGPGGRGGRCRPAEATAPQLRCGHAC